MCKLNSIDDPPCVRRLRDHIEPIAGVAYHAIDVSTFGQVPQFNRVRMQHSSTVTDGQADWQTGQDLKNLHVSSKCSVARDRTPATGRESLFQKCGSNFFRRNFGAFWLSHFGLAKFEKGESSTIKGRIAFSDRPFLTKFQQRLA